jgi:hypothetical protein
MKTLTEERRGMAQGKRTSVQGWGMLWSPNDLIIPAVTSAAVRIRVASAGYCTRYNSDSTVSLSISAADLAKSGLSFRYICHQLGENAQETKLCFQLIKKIKKAKFTKINLMLNHFSWFLSSTPLVAVGLTLLNMLIASYVCHMIVMSVLSLWWLVDLLRPLTN